MGRSGRLFDLKWTVRMNQRIKVYCPKIWVRSKVDGLGSKWTAPSGRSAKVDGPEIQKWTVQREMTVRSEVLNLVGLKG